MTIASLVVDVGANVAKIQSDVNQINKSLGSVEDIAGKLGGALGAAFSVSAVIGFAKELIAFASRMSDVSAQTGIGVEALQALNYAAAGSGVSIDQLANGISQLQKRLSEGSPNTLAALKELGLSITDLRAMRGEQQFIAIAEAIRQLPDPLKQTELAIALMGRSGVQFLPLMKEDMRALTAEAHELGAVMDRDVIEMADAFDDAMARATLRVKGLVAEVVITSTGIDRFALSVKRMNEELKSPAFPIQQVQTLGMSWEEAERVSKELTESVKKQQKPFEENKRAVEQADAAHRAFTNWIGEREIEDVENLQTAIVDMVKAEQDAFNERIDNLQTFADARDDILERDAAEWRDWQNELGLLLMEQDRAQMEHAEAMRFTFSDALNSIATALDQFGGTFEGILGPRFVNAINQFKSAFNEGRNVAQGILRGMAGDFSGWVDAVMAGIRMVKAAWNAISGLFRGGEEGTQVNPARDAFLGQFASRDPFTDANNPPGFHGLAALLHELDSSRGPSLFDALVHAERMDSFNTAMNAILSFLREHGVPGFAGGTRGQFVDFGAGTNVRLHGRERVMTEAEGRAEGGLMATVVSELRRLNAAVTTMGELVPLASRDAMLLARAR